MGESTESDVPSFLESTAIALPPSDSDLAGDLLCERDRFKLVQDPGTQKWLLTDMKSKLWKSWFS